MGFRKWLFKNGPGSPGHTARSLIKSYNTYSFQKETGEEDIAEIGIYSMIYLDRCNWASKLNNKGALLKNYNYLKLIDFASNDMSLFVFIIECLETSQFRKGLTLGMDGVNDILEVIREEVKAKQPDLIKIDDIEYRNKALTFADILLESLDKGRHTTPETLDAFFKCEDYPNGYLIKFYKDLTIQYVITDITLGDIDFEKVSKWFTKEYKYSQKSLYKFYDSQITFKMKTGAETYFTYTCTFVSKDEFLMKIENSVTREIIENRFWRFSE